MDNILFCSVGRRATLLKYLRQSMNGCGKLIAADLSPVAPALFFADASFLVPRIDASGYMDKVLEICVRNDVRAITSLIDPEIELLAKHRTVFEKMGVLLLCPAVWTAQLCFDKYKMYTYLRDKGIRTVLTYDSLEGFKEGLDKGEVSFPVFMKPVSGSGSVGIDKVCNWEEAFIKFNDGKFVYIIQELMTGGDCNADVYVDCISHKPVAIFGKKKIESRMGGANKTVSFKDQKLYDFVEEVCAVFELNGPCDMDFFIKDGAYYLTEINPRFGGAYLHAHRAGVDFIKLIINNMHGIENTSTIGEYEEDVVMMMYDDVVLVRKSELMSTDFPLI